jgi:microsomal epoxide hydrolase
LYHAALAKDTLAGNPIPISKEKPMGYSLFSHDLAVLPYAWVKHIYPNMVFFQAHAIVSSVCMLCNLLKGLIADSDLQGGHFAALEQPKALLEDVEEFVGAVHKLFKAE